jgi:metal-responsive CopG/Arc/MetJ family transcriptional regulator
MTTKTFNVAFPVTLLSQVDDYAQSEFGSRSDLLRQAALEFIERRDKIKELFREGKKLQETAQLNSDKEVAEYITQLRRAKAA